MSEIPKIHGAMCRIMEACDGITKDQTSDQGYKFRSVDGAYNALHDILVKERVFTVPRLIKMTREERLSSRGKTMLYTIVEMNYDFVCEDGSLITVGPVLGEALDIGDKSATKAQSIAHKICLLQTFMVPTLLSADTGEGEQHEIHSPDDDAPGGPAIPLAIDDQWTKLNAYRDKKITTGQMNEYLDSRKESLTYKQANQLLAKIEASMEVE
jgi:hypothetical protein